MVSYSTFPLNPEFPVQVEPRWATARSGLEPGGSQKRRATRTKSLRVWDLPWQYAGKEYAEKVRAFHRDHRGGAWPFWLSPADPVPAPCDPPVLGSVSGGTLDPRTVYVKFTWGDATHETTASGYATLSLAYNLRVTVTVPDFPANVTKAYVYCGPTADTLYKQTTPITVSGGEWTEPIAGYDTGGGSPPSSNTLTETVLVAFAEDEFELTKFSAVRYAFRAVVEEVRRSDENT